MHIYPIYSLILDTVTSKRNIVRPLSLTFDYIKDIVSRRVGKNNHSCFSQNLLVVTNNQHLLSTTFLGNDPFMLHYTLFGFVSKGQAVVTINLQPQTVMQGCLVVLNSDTIYEVESCTDDFTFDIFIMSDSLVNMLFQEHKPKILDRLSNNLIPLNREQEEIAVSLIDVIIRVFKSCDCRETSVYDLLRGIIKYCDDIRQTICLIEKQELSREQEIFNTFLNLLNTYANRGERSISFYADNLCISNNYLSIVVSRVSGVTAKEWIERAVIMEAKALLKFSTLSIMEIADKLNFANDSFFNKYFKRNVGCTPLRFRNRV